MESLRSTDIWREAWLQKHAESILSWNDLAGRGRGNEDEQSFWRKTPRSNYLLNDELMLRDGLLFELPELGLVHIAYIPWDIQFNGSSKSEWGVDEWNKLNRALIETVKLNGQLKENFDWERLTIPSGVATELLQASLGKSQIVGSVNLSVDANKNIASNLFEGDVVGSVSHIKDATVLGAVRFVNRSGRIERSEVSSVFYEGSQPEGCDVNLEDSTVLSLTISTQANSVRVMNSSIFEFNLHRVKVGRIRFEGDGSHSIGCRFVDTDVMGRFHSIGVRLGDPDEGRPVSFDYTKFMEKVRLHNVDFQLSVFARSQFVAPVDLSFDHETIEDVFESELEGLQSEIDSKEFEDGRARLESACQVLCDRHRQDGRKDLEHRFRRMEMKAKSYRSSSDKITKMLNRSYSYFSDFGRSVLRPIRGIGLIWMASFLIYLALSSIELGATKIFSGSMNWGIVRDAALLSTDKIFPFGVSVNENELFGGKMLGVEGGGSSIIFGFLGAIQTILSGLMFFLVGLAVRTKLLIG